jgi:hypothetical protein
MNRLGIGARLRPSFSHDLGKLRSKEFVLWSLVTITAFLLICIAQWRPYYTNNEAVYLLGLIQSENPILFSQDWSLITWPPNSPFAFLLRLIDSIIPFPQSIFVTRVFGWFFCITTISLLVRAVGIGPLAFLLGTMSWIYVGQSIFSNEFIFGGSEPKTISYGFLFLSILFLVKDKPFLSFLFLGISASFHPLIGLLSCPAIYFAFTIQWKLSTSNFIHCSLISAIGFLVGSSVGLFEFILHILDSGPLSVEATKELVIRRNPHHLDSTTFLSGRLLARVAIMLVCLGYLCFVLRVEASVKKLAAFMLVLLVEAILGIIASERQYFGFLVYYPFRVFSVLFPLYFWLIAMHYVLILSTRKILNGSLFYKIGTLFVCWYCTYLWSTTDAPTRPIRDLRHIVENPLFFESTDAQIGALNWINKYTKKTDTILSPPWISEFWIVARRAQFISLKIAPPNKSFDEWSSRVDRVLGHDAYYQNKALESGVSHYNRISKYELNNLISEYSIRYYLTTKQRSDLSEYLVYEQSGYFIYNLHDF